MLDFSAAQGIGLTDAAKLLSKSLGSSTNALTRYGIEITGAVGSQERLETAITNMSSKFLGQAEAATVGAGKLQQFENQVGDLQEKIGGLIVRGITPFVNGLARLVGNISDFVKPSKEMQNELALTQVALNKELEVLKSGNLSQEARKVLIDRINTSYGEYLPNLISEKTTLSEINTIQEKANKLITTRIITQALQKEFAEILKLQLDAQKSIVDLEIIQEENSQDAATNRDERLANSKTQLNEQLESFKNVNKAIAGNTEANLQKVEDRYRRLAEVAGIAFDDILNSINGSTEALNINTEAVGTNAEAKEEADNNELERIERKGLKTIATSDTTAKIVSTNNIDFVEEQQIIAQAEAELLNARIAGAQQLTTALADFAGQNTALAKGLFIASKAFAIADIAIKLQQELAAIALQAKSSSALFPLGAPVFATIAATQAITAKTRAGFGIAAIVAQTVSGFQKGGIVDGPSHAQGGVPIVAQGGTVIGEMEGKEAVINTRSTAMFRNELSAINVAGGGRSFQAGGIPNLSLDAGTDANIEIQRSIRNIDLRPQVSVREINEVNQRVTVIEEKGRL